MEFENLYKLLNILLLKKNTKMADMDTDVTFDDTDDVTTGDEGTE
jgi:hypothetical protein